MIYHTGRRVQWRPDIPPRKGSQAGTLTQPWERYVTHPWVQWDGEDQDHQQLSECIEPVEDKPTQATVNAWDEYQPGRAKR